MRNLIKRAKASDIDLPLYLHYPHKETWLSFHIKCLYNTRCGWARDCHPYPARANRALMHWYQNFISGRVDDKGSVKQHRHSGVETWDTGHLEIRRKENDPPSTSVSQGNGEEASDTGWRGCNKSKRSIPEPLRYTQPTSTQSMTNPLPPEGVMQICHDGSP